MIELKNVNFFYRNTHILKNISVSFEKNKIYGIIGPNGCGKTTLLETISGIKQYTSGKIIIDERDSQKYSNKLMAQKISYLQQTSSIPDMNVFDYISYGRYPHLDFWKNLSKYDIEIINKALEMTETKDFIKRNVQHLSGGERQRVNIAMLFSQNTSYILMDEPTTYLDISSRFLIMDILRKIINPQKCIITVMHEIELAFKYCDMIIVINNGEICCCDTPKNIIKNKYIEDIFNVKCVYVDSADEYFITKKAAN